MYVAEEHKTHRVEMSSDEVDDDKEGGAGTRELPGVVIGHANLVCREREVGSSARYGCWSLWGRIQWMCGGGGSRREDGVGRRILRYVSAWAHRIQPHIRALAGGRIPGYCTPGYLAREQAMYTPLSMSTCNPPSFPACVVAVRLRSSGRKKRA